MAKTILITGGGSGIGRAVAAKFASEGWRVVVADINAAGAAETVAMLPTGQGQAFTLDVTDRAAWANLMLELSAWSGGALNVLHNNAGVGIGGPIDANSDAEVDTLIGVNLTGVINGTRACMPLLEAAARGGEMAVILNTSSASAYYGSAGLSIYSATKFAVRALTEAWDIELAARGIKARAILPSFIDTPLLNQTPSGSNHTTREVVIGAGLEFTPVEDVATAAWDVVHGERVHIPVGVTAKRLAFAAKWMPGRLAKRFKLMEKAG